MLAVPFESRQTGDHGTLHQIHLVNKNIKPSRECGCGSRRERILYSVISLFKSVVRTSNNLRIADVYMIVRSLSPNFKPLYAPSYIHHSLPQTQLVVVRSLALLENGVGRTFTQRTTPTTVQLSSWLIVIYVRWRDDQFKVYIHQQSPDRSI